MATNVLDCLDYTHTSAYLAWHKNKEIRHFASSGGVARGLILELLTNKLVDAVYTLYDDQSDQHELTGKWLTGNVNHCKIPSSIYRPVFWGKHLADVLPDWKRILIVGLPCQIKGTKAFFDKYHPKIHVVTIVIFCKKQKAKDMTNTYLRHFRMSLNEIKDFRYRGEGYPGCFRVLGKSQPSAPFIYPAKAWYPFGCRFCLDPLLQKEADFVLADPWQLIDREKENLGKNLMILQSQQAMQLFEKLESIEAEKIEDLNQAYFTSLTLESYRKKSEQANKLKKNIFNIEYLLERFSAHLAETFFYIFGPNSRLSKSLLKIRQKHDGSKL